MSDYTSDRAMLDYWLKETKEELAALRAIAEQLAEALVTTEGFINLHFHMSPPAPKDCKRCRLPHDTKAALAAWKEYNRES